MLPTPPRPRVAVYVDGFNLYYGALQGHVGRKWLDLRALARRLVRPGSDIVRVTYCTALISPRPHEPDQPQRQQAYLRALRTLPEAEILLGHFLTSRKVMPRADGAGTVDVIKTEEKGSDVNLAVRLVADSFLNRYDTALVISSDSDLLEAVRIARAQGKVVGVFIPEGRRCDVLFRVADFRGKIRPQVIAACQFSNPLTDAQGTFHKPLSW